MLSEINNFFHRQHDVLERLARLHIFRERLTGTAVNDSEVATLLRNAETILLPVCLEEARLSKFSKRGVRAEETRVGMTSILESLRQKHDARKEKLNVKLNSLESQEVAALMSVFFRAIQLVEEVLNEERSVVEEQLRQKLSAWKISQSSETLLAEHIRELDRLDLKEICLPFQSFQCNSTFPLLLHLASSKPRLVLIDLSHCLLGDDLAKELLPSISSLQHLRALMLPGNALTDDFGRALLSLLQIDVDLQPTFPNIQLLNVDENEMSHEVLTFIDSALRAAASRSGRAPRLLRLPQHRTLVLIAPCMKACSIAQFFARQQTDDFLRLYCDAVDTFCGSSFASVIAAALALRLPLEAVAAFFHSLANQVFAPYRYAYYAVAAARAARCWLSGGNYYSKHDLTALLESLFGEYGRKSLKEISDITGKRLAFAVVDSASKRALLLRSWEPIDGRHIVDHLPLALNITLVDALLAACSTPSYFAPHPCNGVQVEDALVFPAAAFAVENITNTGSDTPLSMSVVSPVAPLQQYAEFGARPFSNPVLHSAVVSSMRKLNQPVDMALVADSLLAEQLRRLASMRMAGRVSFDAKHAVPESLHSLFVAIKLDEANTTLLDHFE
jgi:hypothetical protein